MESREFCMVSLECRKFKFDVSGNVANVMDGLAAILSVLSAANKDANSAPND